MNDNPEGTFVVADVSQGPLYITVSLCILLLSIFTMMIYYDAALLI